MKHLFLINPAAGSYDRTKAVTRQILECCQGLDYRVEISQGPGDCFRLARQAAKSGEDYRIYACGGDGTLNEVAAGAAGYANAAVTVLAGAAAMTLSGSSPSRRPSGICGSSWIRKKWSWT